MIASYAGCNRAAVVAMLIMGMGMMGTFYSGIKANSLDIAPNYAGTITDENFLKIIQTY